jgi:hypothetical protein
VKELQHEAVKSDDTRSKIEDTVPETSRLYRQITNYGHLNQVNCLLLRKTLTFYQANRSTEKEAVTDPLPTTSDRHTEAMIDNYLLGSTTTYWNPTTFETLNRINKLLAIDLY